MRTLCNPLEAYNSAVTTFSSGKQYRLMHISDILKEPSEKLYSRTYRESYKNPCEVAVPLTHIFFHFENSGAVAVPRTHIFFHFQALVRWPYHSRTYSSIFKLWCGGRTTHAHILPFTNSCAVAVPLTHIFFHFQNSCAVAEPLTHIFFHFQNSGAVAVPLTHIFFHFKNSGAVAEPLTH